MHVYAMFFSVSLNSCKDDDDEPGGGGSPSGDLLVEKLQGTWTIEKMTVKSFGQTIEFDLDDLKNNTGYSNFYDDVLTFNGNEVNGLAYSVDGNKIMLPWYEDYDEGWWATVSFSGNQMTMYYDINYEGVKMEMWITYTKSSKRSISIDVANTNSIIPIAIEAIKK